MALVHPQVVVEALFTQKPSALVKVFIIVVSLILGLVILAALVWCLWKVNIFDFTNYHRALERSHVTIHESK